MQSLTPSNASEYPASCIGCTATAERETSEGATLLLSLWLEFPRDARPLPGWISSEPEQWAGQRSTKSGSPLLQLVLKTDIFMLRRHVDTGGF